MNKGDKGVTNMEKEKILHVVFRGNKHINHIVKEDSFIVHTEGDIRYWLWNLETLGGHTILKYWVTESK